MGIMMRRPPPRLDLSPNSRTSSPSVTPGKKNSSGSSPENTFEAPPPAGLLAKRKNFLSLQAPSSPLKEETGTEAENNRSPSPSSPRPQSGELTPLGRGLSTPQQKIPEYNPENKVALSHGQFGETSLVTGKNGPFILKEMEIDSLAQRANKNFQAQAEQMRVEIKAMDLINGIPHVPEFLGSGEVHHRTELEDHHTLDIAMNVAPGKLAKESTLTEDEAKILAKQLFETLHRCHEKGVAHLDVKPSNILWDSEHKNITLIDFGEARLFDPEQPILDKHLSEGAENYRNLFVTKNDVVKIDTYAAAKTCEEILSKQEEISEEAKNFISRALTAKDFIKDLLKDPWFNS